eukprot:6865648-Prorocentrum_lima.AAC.1
MVAGKLARGRRAHRLLRNIAYVEAPRVLLRLVVLIFHATTCRGSMISWSCSLGKVKSPRPCTAV